MSSEEVLVVFLSLLTLVGFAAILGGFLHARRERLLLHAERMKAMELGQPMPEDRKVAQQKALAAALEDPPQPDPDRAMARKCFSTALWVAFWGFLFAGGSASADAAEAVAYIIAGGAGATALASVIGGAVLAYRASVADQHRTTFAPVSKAPYEPDAYDVVGARSRLS